MVGFEVVETGASPGRGDGFGATTLMSVEMTALRGRTVFTVVSDPEVIPSSIGLTARARFPFSGGIATGSRGIRGEMGPTSTGAIDAIGDRSWSFSFGAC